MTYEGIRQMRMRCNIACPTCAGYGENVGKGRICATCHGTGNRPQEQLTEWQQDMLLLIAETTFDGWLAASASPRPSGQPASGGAT